MVEENEMEREVSNYAFKEDVLLLAKILLVPQNCKIVIVLSNSPLLVNSPLLLCFIFGISFATFLDYSLLSYRSSKYHDSNSCRPFSLLEAIGKTFPLLFAKRATTIAVAKER